MASPAEERFHNWFKKSFPTIVIERQISPPGCINDATLRSLRFDFYIPSLKLFVEIDGKQHFKPLKRYGQKEADFDKQHMLDNIKMDHVVNMKDHYLLRIKGGTIMRNMSDWKDKFVAYMENAKFQSCPSISCLITSVEYKKMLMGRM